MSLSTKHTVLIAQMLPPAAATTPKPLFSLRASSNSPVTPQQTNAVTTPSLPVRTKSVSGLSPQGQVMQQQLAQQAALADELPSETDGFKPATASKPLTVKPLQTTGVTLTAATSVPTTSTSLSPTTEQAFKTLAAKYPLYAQAAGKWDAALLERLTHAEGELAKLPAEKQELARALLLTAVTHAANSGNAPVPFGRNNLSNLLFSPAVSEKLGITGNNTPEQQISRFVAAVGQQLAAPGAESNPEAFGKVMQALGLPTNRSTLQSIEKDIAPLLQAAKAPSALASQSVSTGATSAAGFGGLINQATGLTDTPIINGIALNLTNPIAEANNEIGKNALKLGELDVHQGVCVSYTSMVKQYGSIDKAIKALYPNVTDPDDIQALRNNPRGLLTEYTPDRWGPGIIPDYAGGNEYTNNPLSALKQLIDINYTSIGSGTTHALPNGKKVAEFTGTDLQQLAVIAKDSGQPITFDLFTARSRDVSKAGFLDQYSASGGRDQGSVTIFPDGTSVFVNGARLIYPPVNGKADPAVLNGPYTNSSIAIAVIPPGVVDKSSSVIATK